MNVRLQKLKALVRPLAIGVWRFVVKVFMCKIMQSHDWTSAAQEGVPPTPEQLAGGVVGFWDYAKMYCKRCDVESMCSRLSRAKAAAEAVHG